MKLRTRSKVALFFGSTATVSLALAGCAGGGSTAATEGGDAGGGSKTVVTVGWVPTVAWIGWLGTVDSLDSDEFTLKLTDFKSSSDTLVSLTNGSIDIGAVGYNVLADALGQSDVPVQYIAGASTKSAVVLVRKGAGIETWSDLKGKRVGAVRGSAEYIHLKGALKAQSGLSLEKDTKFVNFSSGSDDILALQRGDIDATVTYEPLASQAVVSGGAERAPAMQKNLFSDTFEVSSGILARNEFLKNHPDWTKEILSQYKKTVEQYRKDPESALKTYQKYATGDPAVLKEALGNVTLLYGMDEEQVGNVATTLVKAGQLKKDVSKQLTGHLNYEYLSDATGEAPAALGKSS